MNCSDLRLWNNAYRECSQQAENFPWPSRIVAAILTSTKTNLITANDTVLKRKKTLPDEALRWTIIICLSASSSILTCTHGQILILRQVAGLMTNDTTTKSLQIRTPWLPRSTEHSHSSWAWPVGIRKGMHSRMIFHDLLNNHLGSSCLFMQYGIS